MPDGSAGAVLLLGPLYHLYTGEHRLQALAEAKRVARQNAPVFVAAISRWAPRLHGFLTRRLYNQIPDLEEALDQVEQHGVMDPLFPGSFSGYAHRPDDLREELGAAGLAIDDLVNVEGLAFALPDLAERMTIAADRHAVHGLLRRRPVW